MATRKHRDVYVTDERWETLIRQAGDLHPPRDRPVDVQVDNMVEAALICLRRASYAEVCDCLHLAKRLETPREQPEAAVAPCLAGIGRAGRGEIGANT